MLPNRPCREGDEGGSTLAKTRGQCHDALAPPLIEAGVAFRRRNGETAPSKDLVPGDAGDDASAEKVVRSLVLLVA